MTRHFVFIKDDEARVASLYPASEKLQPKPSLRVLDNFPAEFFQDDPKTYTVSFYTALEYKLNTHLTEHVIWWYNQSPRELLQRIRQFRSLAEANGYSYKGQLQSPTDKRESLSEGKMPNLVTWQGGTSAYVTYGDAEIYLRDTYRYVLGRRLKSLDLVRITRESRYDNVQAVDNPTSTGFMREVMDLLDHKAWEFDCDIIYVESVLNGFLPDWFKRNGFSQVIGEFPYSFWRYRAGKHSR